MSHFQVLNLDYKKGDRLIVHYPSYSSAEYVETLRKEIEEVIKNKAGTMIPNNVTFTILRVGSVPQENADFLVTLKKEEEF